MKSKAININVDAGESFGNYRFGLDQELIELVPTINVACGAHAGDPHVMRETVAWAAKAGVEVGAHVGLPDRVGFGRRWIDISPEELADLVTFQIGALYGFTHAAEVPLTHVKPHGVLFVEAGRRDQLRSGLLEAVAAFDPELPVILGGNPNDHPQPPAGMAVVSEGYADLDMSEDGYPIVERKKTEVEPELAVERALAIALRSEFPSRAAGRDIALPVPTLCVHSDTPNAVALVRAIREAFDREEVRLTGLSEAIHRL